MKTTRFAPKPRNNNDGWEQLVGSWGADKDSHRRTLATVSQEEFAAAYKKQTDEHNDWLLRNAIEFRRQAQWVEAAEVMAELAAAKAKSSSPKEKKRRRAVSPNGKVSNVNDGGAPAPRCAEMPCEIEDEAA